MRYFFILIILFSFNIYAHDVTLYDQEPFANNLVYIDFDDGSISTMSDENGLISFETDSKTAEITIFTDNRYHAKISLPHAEMVQMKPVATISGFIVDANENLISEAQLKFICTGEIFSEVPTHSDEIGFFKVEDVEFGQCVINVIKDEKIYSEEITIDQSKEYPVRFVIKGLKFRQSYLFSGLLLAIIFIGILYLFYRLSRKDRQKDIMKTLRPKDIEVIECIRSNGGCVTQSQIRHNTKIPKSSLHRTLSNLEQKGILAMREYDGVKKIEFTSWFRKQ